MDSQLAAMRRRADKNFDAYMTLTHEFAAARKAWVEREAKLEQALHQARNIIMEEFGRLDPEEPWDFIDDVLKESNG